MSTCSNCGTQVTVGSRYCATCGSAVTVEQNSAPTQQIRRPSAESIATGEQRLLETLRSVTLGEYEVVCELGRGGMAVVFLAHDISLDRKVAIKVMAPALMLMDSGIQARFKREARTAASLSHPNIIPVYAVKDSQDIVYFIMKYVSGRSLESVIKEIGPFPVPMVQTILSQVGSALGYAHRNGVVHRDMKPGNIMLDEEGWVVVMDFGIAKVAQAEALTMTGGVVGTPSYMSPEQCAGREVEGASDQYSLGVVAYEMITGRQPFAGGTMMNLMYDHCNTPPPSIADIRPDCPPELASAVMRMLDKEPENRWPSVEDAVAAIGTVTDSQSGTVRVQMLTLAQAGSAAELLEKFRTPGSPIPPSAAASPPPSSSPAVAKRPETTPEAVGAGASSGSHWLPKGLWAIPVLAVVTAGAWFGFARGTTTEQQPASEPASPPTVSAPTVARLEVEPLTASIAVGQRVELTATPHDDAAGVVANAPVVWESGDIALATVSPAGVVYGVAAGVTQITARSGGGSAAITVTVSAPARQPATDQPSRVVSNTPDVPTNDELPTSLSTGEDRSSAEEEPATPTPVSSVSADSSVSAVAPGSATITATSDTASVAARATVEEPAPAQPVDPRPEIESVLERYRRAIESHDLDRLKQAYPGMTSDQERAWRDFFGSATNLAATFRILTLDTSDNTARARVEAVYEYRAGRDQTQTFEFTATLERSGAGWRLTSVE